MSDTDIIKDAAWAAMRAVVELGSTLTGEVGLDWTGEGEVLIDLLVAHLDMHVDDGVRAELLEYLLDEMGTREHLGPRWVSALGKTARRKYGPIETEHGTVEWNPFVQRWQLQWHDEVTPARFFVSRVDAVEELARPDDRSYQAHS